jgi:quercetin dioxygenase-like cupin family protein
VRRGEFIFVPRNVIHGTVATRQGPLTLLAAISPKIDLAEDVVWEAGAVPPRFQVA